jgi:hypothetical protein
VLPCARAGAQESKDPHPFEERRIAVVPEDVPLSGRGQTVFVGPGGKRVIWLKSSGPGQAVVALDGTECKPIESWMGLSTPRESSTAVIARSGPFLWSADGKHAAWQAHRGSKSLLVVDGVEGEPVDQLLQNSVTFSADWAHVAYAAKEGAKSFVVLDGKKLGEKYDEVDAPVSLGRDGRDVAYRARRGKTWQIVMNDRELGSEYRDVRSPVLSPDGRRVAFVGSSEKGEHLVADGVQGPLCDIVSELQFSPDGRRIACRAKIGATWHVLVDGAKGEPFRDISYETLTFSGDGKQVAYMADKRLIVNGKAHPLLEMSLGGPIFSPDGTRVAYIGQSSQTGYDVFVDGKVIGGAYASGFVFSPSGRHIAFVAGRQPGYIVVDRNHGEDFEEIVGVPVFSADDKKVGYPVRKGRDILWKVETVIPELGPGDPAMIQTFERVRAVLEKSAGVRIRRTCEGTAEKPGDPPVKFQETILIKGNRLKVTSETADHGAASWLISDGTTVRLTLGTPSNEAPATADLQESFSSAVAYGIPSSVWVYLGANKPRAYEVKQADGGLSYVVVLGEYRSVIRVRVWFDPKTYALVKRVLQLDRDMGMGTLTETYEECAVDPAIPDAEFTLKK